MGSQYLTSLCVGFILLFFFNPYLLLYEQSEPRTFVTIKEKEMIIVFTLVMSSARDWCGVAKNAEPVVLHWSTCSDSVS